MMAKLNVCVIVLTCLLGIAMMIIYHDWRAETTNSYIVAIGHQLGAKAKHQHQQITLINMSENITDKFKCVEMGANPHPYICLHPKTVDSVVSVHILRYGAFELHYVNLALKMLKMYPSAGFLDIGANIGQYSLVAAKLGRQVVAVEPLTTNARRFTKAVQLNKMQDNITIIQNGLRNSRVVMPFIFFRLNPGASRLRGEPMTYEEAMQKGYVIGKNATSTILMDDLLPYCKFGTAIMKMDIEGYEARAIHGARKLFEKLQIPYILMEWVNLAKWLKSKDENEATFLKDMLEFLKDSGYTAHDGRSLALLSWERHGEAWPQEIIWIHKGAKTLHKNGVQ